MQGQKFLPNVSKAIATSLFLVTLSACLTEETAEIEQEDASIDNHITGSVGDGPVVGATLQVLSKNNDVLKEFVSDSTATFDTTIKAKGSQYPLTIIARNGTDLVTSSQPDFTMYGLVGKPGKKTTANINPFTTMVNEISRDLSGGRTAENFSIAESIVVNALNSGLSSIKSSGPMTTPIDSSNISEIVKASEALGETIRRTRDYLQMFGFSSSGSKVTQRIASDVIDERIDGRGGERIDARTSAVFIITCALVMLESAANELHVHDVDATVAMTTAIEHVNGGAPDSTLAEVTVTTEMLSAIRVGIAAAYAVEQTPAIAELRSAVDGVQPGMGPELIRSLLPSNYRSTMSGAIMTVAGGDVSVINTVNSVAMGGGEAPVNNRAPSISGMPAGSIVAGNAYSFEPVATDPDGDALQFSIVNQPPWSNFDITTGALTGTPGDGDVGTYSDISITVSDGGESASLALFSIEVGKGNSAPTISGSPATSVSAGNAYTFTPTASDPDGDTLAFSIASKPLWASFDNTTGRLFGTAGGADVGIHGNIVITVTDGTASASLAPFEITVDPVITNSAPTISGIPPTSVTAGSSYSFAPTASDPDGDTLTFSINNKPSWASFDTANGALTGTPSSANVGVYNNVTITVSDGTDSAELGPFSITVDSISLGSVTLSWTAPTENEDGTPLTDLAGYRIYWGMTSGTYPNSVTIDNPGLMTYVIDNLAPGTYEFVATSFDATGVESAYSNPATMIVSEP